MAVKEYCTVDINTRVISIPENQRTIGVEHDKNVYRLYFKIARKPTEDFDLMNSVIYINYRNANKDVGQFMVSDLKQDGEFVNFSWLINSGTLSYKGNIDFIICARQATGDELYKEWNTTLAHCVCLEGIEPKENEGIEEAEKDIITQLIQYANNLHNQSTILNADSEKLHNQAEELSKIAIDASEKANDALDRALTPVTDVDFYKGRILSGMTYSGKASNKGVKLHRVEGNSVQDGTPTPGNPIEIKNVEINKLQSSGRNLLDSSENFTLWSTKITFMNNGRDAKVEALKTASSLGVVIPINLSNDMLEGKEVIISDYTFEKSTDNIIPCIMIAYIDENNAYVKSLKLFENGAKGSLKLPNKLSYRIGIFLYVNSSVAQTGDYIIYKNIYFYLKDSSIAEYEPFKLSTSIPSKPILLRSLPGGVKDIYENDVITRRVEEVIFDGSQDEGWTLDILNKAIYPNGFRYKGSNTRHRVLSNKYPTYLNYGEYRINELTLNINNLLVIGVDLNNFDLEQFKSELVTNPLKVYIGLPTPIIEKVDVPTIPSYYPFTNVWTDNEVETDMQWELLANSDDSLKVEELEKRILALETKMIGG